MPDAAVKKVLDFPATTTFQPEHALKSALDMATNGLLTDVLVVGYDDDGCLVVRSSAMSRAEALWLCEKLRQHVLDA